MPYLEVTKNQEDEKENIVQVEMPELTGITSKEAKQILKDLGIAYEIDTDEAEAVITKQLPKKGIQINSGTKVFLYTD